MNSAAHIYLRALVLLCLAWFVFMNGAVRCEEGMWLPHSLPDEVMADMRTAGLELDRNAIFNAAGTGIANAVVAVGASGSFVSPDGLILTNHHVAYGAVQRISTAERNYIETGFLARSPAEEVPAYGYRAHILLSSEDVTSEVLADVTPDMSPLERHDAIEAATKEIVRRAEADRDVYCEVSAFLGGLTYRLDTYLRLLDIRVVYVPSRSIGEYGGDIDNWMWPRHTGDFSFLRAYVGPDGAPAEYSDANVPYRPTSYLRIAPQGLRNEDFTMVIGYPGRTSRYLTSYELAFRRDFDYPEHIRIYRRTLDAIAEATEGDPEGVVRVASRVKGINNRLKNNLGMLDGFKHFNLVEREAEKERVYSAGFEADPVMLDTYRDLLNSFRVLSEDRLEHAMGDLILESMVSRGTLLSQAMLLYTWSIEKAKDDMDREPRFMNREIPAMKMGLRIFDMGFYEKSDRAVLRMLLAEALALPEGERIEAIGPALGGKGSRSSSKDLGVYLDRLYAGTHLESAENRLRMFDMSNEDLMAEGDTFINLAAELYGANQARLEREKAFDGAVTLLRPQWIELISVLSDRPLYPDANGTMRLNYGLVEGYSPKDAVYYEPFTTLTGVAEKATGIPPFDAPEALLELAGIAGHGEYDDPFLGDVPVDVLTTNDTTGGNSGSPLINGRGELVGCLFDGNYEAMTSDYVFMDDLTRSISVDIRYVLFIADRIDHAANVLEELGVR
jgi:hypothetical protein